MRVLRVFEGLEGFEGFNMFETRAVLNKPRLDLESAITYFILQSGVVNQYISFFALNS